MSNYVKSEAVLGDLLVSQKFLNGDWRFDSRREKIYTRDGKEICGTKRDNGYVRVTSSFHGKRFDAYLHRIIYIATHGYRALPEGTEIDHINGIKTDNRIENLRAVSHSENCMNPNAPSGGNKRKLSDEDVIEIREIWKNKNTLPKEQRPTMKSIGKQYGVTDGAISNIVNNKSYINLQSPKVEVFQ